MTTATTPFVGTFDADPVHSSFNFAVQYQGVSLFRGALEDVVRKLESVKPYLIPKEPRRLSAVFG